MHPDRIPLELRLQMDQVNLAYLHSINFRRSKGDKRAKFSPLYVYPGGPWEEATTKRDLLNFQYRLMPLDEAKAWIAAKKKQQAEASGVN